MLWNSLLDDITTATSLSTFRRKLKTFLLCATTSIRDFPENLLFVLLLHHFGVYFQALSVFLDCYILK